VCHFFVFLCITKLGPLLGEFLLCAFSRRFVTFLANRDFYENVILDTFFGVTKRRLKNTRVVFAQDSENDKKVQNTQKGAHCGKVPNGQNVNPNARFLHM